MQAVKLLIDGKFVESQARDTIDVINPVRPTTLSAACMLKS
jgi:hypothetical protein